MNLLIATLEIQNFNFGNEIILFLFPSSRNLFFYSLDWKVKPCVSYLLHLIFSSCLLFYSLQHTNYSNIYFNKLFKKIRQIGLSWLKLFFTLTKILIAQYMEYNWKVMKIINIRNTNNIYVSVCYQIFTFLCLYIHWHLL